VAKTSAKERREYPRTTVSLPVRMWVDEQMILGRAVDVSEQGLCVITAPTDALKRGDCFRIDMVVGAEDEVSLQGEIRHVTSSLVGLRTFERLKLT
jgi:hypothetical protein